MTYQLLQVPIANLHVATVLVHALGELLGGAGAVVAPVLLLVLVLCGDVVVLLGLFRRGTAAAGEKTPDRVTD